MPEDDEHLILSMTAQIPSTLKAMGGIDEFILSDDETGGALDSLVNTEAKAVLNTSAQSESLITSFDSLVILIVRVSLLFMTLQNCLGLLINRFGRSL